MKALSVRSLIALSATALVTCTAIVASGDWGWAQEVWIALGLREPQPFVYVVF